MDDDARLRAMADEILWRALLLMEEQGVPFPMMIDRLLTVASAHIANQHGSDHAAKVFRELAGNIDRGALSPIERRSTSH